MLKPDEPDAGGHTVDRAGEWHEWTRADAAAWIRVPTSVDDKYSRGVLGVMTGSVLYPGAAVLGVEAAIRTGVGMVRYLGHERPANLVLARRPETVTVSGRVQAWLLGSGMDAAHRDAQTTAALLAALADGVPCVVDAGALDLVRNGDGGAGGSRDGVGAASALVVTPHYRELAALLGRHRIEVTAAEIAADPGKWAVLASAELNATVLLKGGTTFVASPDGQRLTMSSGTPWLSTAGTGDVLGGILGALVATHAERVAADPRLLASVAASAALVHAHAALWASSGGPIAALDVAEAVPTVIADLLTD